VNSVIVPLAAFRLFDVAVTHRRVPFSDRRIFAEFSSLVEVLTLCEDVRYFNVGAYPFEWASGAIIPTVRVSHNPFEPFHGIDFIHEAPIEFMGKGKKLLKMVREDERERIFDHEFGKEPRHEFSLWTYLSAYVQAYNGDFGPVLIKEYPLIGNLLDQILVFENSEEPIAKDSLLIQSYEKLKAKYADKLKNVFEIAITPVVIPPITAILLSRLPDNTSDPFIVVREILDIRANLEVVRQRFADLEAALYSDDASIEDWREAQRAVEADSKTFEKKFDMRFHDNAFVRWFVDNSTFLAKLLIKRDVEKEEMVSFLANLIPTLGNRLSVTTPSLLYDMAVKTKSLPGYPTLVQRKLRLEI